MADAKERALALLKNRDKTEYEIRAALKKAGFPDGDVDETIEYLKGLDYINDESYVTKFIEMSVEKKRGPLRIHRDLAAKGIDAGMIDDLIHEVLDDQWEWDIADCIVTDIKKSNPSLSREKLLTKIVNKLNYEGFSSEVINEIAEELYSD